MGKSAIEWTESTWNPVTGCSKISPGCKNCYAERMARRLQAMGQPNYATGFDVALHDHVLELPISWKKPQTVFVNSMSDLFHEDVPEAFLSRVFDVMRRASWHTFQVLTKRAARLEAMAGRLEWSANVWMGVSVESAKYLNRIDQLRRVPASVRFVSFEPLLESVGAVNLDGVDWAIVGGESGPRARSMEAEWAIEIRNACRAAGVPFFFKQWGGTNKKKAGRLLEGRTWDELPRIVPAAERSPGLRTRRDSRALTDGISGSRHRRDNLGDSSVSV
ncbi:MAG: phage Gp37/Gp68 family protein [Acidobacteriota bacterium]